MLSQKLSVTYSFTPILYCIKTTHALTVFRRNQSTIFTVCVTCVLAAGSHVLVGSLLPSAADGRVVYTPRTEFIVIVY